MGVVVFDEVESNHLSSCVTTKYTYLLHHMYGVLTKEKFLVTSIHRNA